MKSPNPTLFKQRLLPLLFLAFSFFSLTAQQIAFPTAKGAGGYATGGQGGQVIHVTTLDWDAPGGLREAITTTGPRTIVFDVSGEIDASQEYQWNYLIDGPNYSDLTIAGQTAPNGGITIKTSQLFIHNIDNVIIRYVRFRRSTTTGFNSSAVWLRGCTNVIFDHCTVSHGGDETFDLSSSDGESGNITIQNCFFQDSAKGMILGTDTRNEGVNQLPDLGNFTFVNNVFSNISHRFPNTQGNGQYDVINNIVYNWKYRLARITQDGTYNFINNYYKGAANGIHNSNGWFSNYDISNNFLNKLQTKADESPLIYTAGSVIYIQRETPQTDDSDMWSIFTGSHLPVDTDVPAQYFTNTQFPLNGVGYEIKTAHQTLEEVLADVGANKTLNADGTINAYQDSKDIADILMIQNDTYNGSWYDDPSTIPYPEIPHNTRTGDFYISNPHIPELWFNTYVPDGQNHNDFAPSGYTWLEEYLNGVDATFVAIGVIGVEIEPNLDEIQIPNTLQLTTIFTPIDATNQNGLWNSSNESIATVDANGLVTPVSAGSVIITFTSESNLEASDTHDITVLPEALEVSAGTDQVICVGESTTLTATGGTYYNWSTGDTTDTIEVTPEITTIYTVTVSDDFGQSEEVSVTVNVNELPVASAGDNQIICQGFSTTLTATGGTSFLWSTGETTASIEVNPAVETIYSVEVFDNDCSSTADVTVFVNDAPEINISDDVVILEGQSTTLTASGNDNYEWSTGVFGESITVTPIVTTTYSVTSVGPNGCINSASVTVTVVPQIIATAGDDVTSCSGEPVTLTASGGSTYTWNTGDSGSELIVYPTETTTYTVTAEDEFGYTDTDEVTIFINELPDVSVNEDLFVMIGNSITITATGGLSYLWSTGETTSEVTVNPTVTTTYNVTGYSENGCQKTIDVLVTVVELLSANAGPDVSICLGESVTLNASGGITYTWNTGGTGAHPIVSPTETTTYSVTVTDGYGNSDTDDVTVSVDPVPTAVASEDVTICQNDLVTLTAEGGDSYLWSNGETTESITVSPIEDTIYTVEVFTNNCSDSEDVNVFVLPIPELVISEDIVIVVGNSTMIEVTGGDSYLWNTGDTFESFSASPTETTTYSVIAYSANGCQVTDEVTVTVIPEVIANAGDDVSICLGESVTLNASGSNNYLWSSGQSGASISVSPTETTTYTVTVSDDYGYSDTASVTVTVNELPNLTVSENITIFDGESTNLTANGAETYLWSTGETLNTISVSPTEDTTYTVTGYTLNGCEISSQVTVTVIPEVIANAGNDISICIGESVTLNATGSTYYSWNTGQTTASITLTPTETATYTVTVSDDFGNSDSDSVIVTVNELPNLTVSENITIFDGESTNLIANGAETYLWSTGETTNTITVSPTVDTIYTVNGYTINGCEISAQVTVSVIPEVVANAGNDVSICFGQSTTLNATGGTNYLWNTGQTSASITMNPTVTTTYTVTVSDVFGNSDSDSVTVTVNELPTITVSESITIFEGESANLSVNGAVTYLWSTGETTSTITVSPAETTTYIVHGFSDNGCEVLELITVDVIPVLVANAGLDESICQGESITFNASGGFGSVSYLWNTGVTGSFLNVNPTETTTYTVTVYDSFGNSDSDSVTAIVNEIPTITVSEDITIFEGENTTLVASGADSYEWNTNQTSSAITVSPTQTTNYIVTGYSTAGCSVVENVIVTVIPQLIANAGNDVTICIGESVTLTAAGGINFNWSTGETTSSITVNPMETTTYSVTVSDNFGQSETDSVIVTVDDIPNISVSENLTIFEGESTNLTANGADNYIWSTGEVTNTIIVGPAQTTSYTVTGYTVNGCESQVAEVIVTVIPDITANAGSDVTICNGESVTLSASGGNIYSWNTGQTTSTITLTPTETTTYTVTVSDNEGNTDTDSVTVTVYELPIVTVSENITITEGESTNLIVNGAATYLWNTGETSNSINVSPAQTTTYTVTGFSVNGCENTAQVTVTVVPQIIANAGDDVTICFGDSVTLNASGGSIYSWNTGQNNATVTLVPTETTTYTVTVSDSSGNSDTDSVTVTVNELPDVSVSENITIVEGESTNLIANGAETYVWNTGETLSSISVSPTQTTTYTVTGTTSTCSAQAQVTVTVTPLFVASAGTDEHVCDNQSYEVELTANQGDSYLWSTGETTQSIVVSPLSTTSYSVSVTQGQQVDNDEVTVYVDPSPDVVIVNGESVDILNGDFVTLTASGANNYEWSNGALQPNIAVSPSVTTTYEVRGFIGDCYDEKQITVNVLEPVTADAGEDVLICLEEMVALTATGGDDYVWSTGEITPTIQVSPSVTTDYTVTVFNALDYDEATVRVEVDTNCSEQIEDPIEGPLDFAFDVYPNPANNVINVKLSGSILVSDIYIFDVTGKLIQQIRITNEDLGLTSTTQIDISSLNSGVYFVKLADEERDVTKKLIVN